jgi:hypothetical protein
MNVLKTLVVAVSLTVNAMSAQAALLSVDFNAGSPNQSGFQSFDLGGYTNVSIDNTMTYGSQTVRLQIPTTGGQLVGAFDRGVAQTIPVLSDLYRDFAFSNNGQAITVTIGGLTPLAQYALTLYAYDNDSGDGSLNLNTKFTPTTGGASATVLYNTTTPPTTAGQYAANVDWTANGAGQITFTALGSVGAPGAPTATRINGFSITPIVTPEPSSVLLGGFGIVGLLVAIRRSRKG